MKKLAETVVAELFGATAGLIDDLHFYYEYLIADGRDHECPQRIVEILRIMQRVPDFAEWAAEHLATFEDAMREARESIKVAV